MKNIKSLSLSLSSLLLIGLTIGACSQAKTPQPASLELRTEVISNALSHPWGMAFLPDGRILVSERGGDLRVISAEGKLHPEPIEGLPIIEQYGQGGLLDVALHPSFESNQLVYFSFAENEDENYGTAVGRGRLEGHALTDVEVIFRLLPKSDTPYHFGSRLVFDRDGLLYVTLGDRGKRPRAQDLNDHAGSLIRIHDDGRIPADNPFVSRSDAKPEIYSYGHRNIQGAALHPQTGRLWTHEHGPQGGDELNLSSAGANHGWPVITYGKNYVTGTSIGEGTERADIEAPIHYWVPSIAPSGMAFNNGSRYPGWEGNLFIGSLKFQQLVRLELDGEKVVHEERLLEEILGRIRDVRFGPDGYLYLLTDENEGSLVKLLAQTPKTAKP